MSEAHRRRLVEADPDRPLTLKDILAPPGHAPVVFGREQAALEWANRETATVALIDLRLENRSGLEALPAGAPVDRHPQGVRP